MIYRCAHCLNLSTRPNSCFKKGEACEPCKASEKKISFNDNVDEFWNHVQKLEKNKNARDLKFVLGVSGGKDSLRQALFCRHILKIEPILVSVGYPPSMTTELGISNLRNLYNKNYEIYVAYPASATYKELAKYCFFELGNLKVAMEIALFNGAASLGNASKADIILWGENPAFSVGDEGAKGESYFDGTSIMQINTLKHADKLPIETVSKHKFFYDLQSELEKIKHKLVFLGSIMPHWSQVNNGISSLFCGFTPRKNSVVDYLNISAVDEDFVLINQYIKYLKFGFGRTTDIVNELIREGVVTRTEGLELVKEYEPYLPKKEIQRFSKFIDTDEELVWTNIYKNMNQELFELKGHKVIEKKMLSEAL